MKLHTVSEFEALDRIEEEAEQAQTEEEAERIDARYFGQPPELRQAWLEFRDPRLYHMLTDHRMLTN
jgi:hypothetical protein